MIENKIQTEVKKSRRGLPRHTKNPFLYKSTYKNWRQTYYYRKRSISIS